MCMITMFTFHFEDKEKKEQVFIFIVCEQQLLGQVFEYFKLVFAYMLMGYYLGRQSEGMGNPMRLKFVTFFLFQIVYYFLDRIDF